MSDHLIPEDIRLPAKPDEAQIESTLGQAKKLTLEPLGRCPYNRPEIRPAWWSLSSTYDSVTRLFDTVYLVRTDPAKVRAGRLSRDALELLRASIVFTSAGVDACLSQLIRYAAPPLTQYNETARRKFSDYIKEQVNAASVIQDFRDALCADDPRQGMLALYIDHLVRPSFQGSTDIKNRARDALGITNGQIPQRRISALDPFFTARNEVVHEMDQLPSTGTSKPKRRPRNQNEVRDMCNGAFQLLRDMITAAVDNLKSSAVTPKPTEA